MVAIIAPKRLPLARQPLVFLAGPIKGAYDWQQEALDFFQEHDSEILIASPRAPSPWHGDYDLQVTWEQDHLDYAMRHGIILFWCAREQEHRCDRAYAQTTRIELGLYGIRGDMHHCVVGIEEGFSGMRYLKHTLEQRYPQTTIYETLIDTCRSVLARIHGKRLSRSGIPLGR